MNVRAEYIRPAIQRMAHVDLLDDNRGRGPGAIWLERSSYIFLSTQIYRLLVLFKTILFRDFYQNHLGAKCKNYPLTLSKGSYEDSEKLRVNYLIDFSITFLCYKNKNKKIIII